MVARPYTPVTLPGTDKIVLGIKQYDGGAMSGWMAQRTPGDTISIRELTGNLFLRNPDDDAVFLSTGTGITPMLAMLRHYLRDGSGQATFLYGERTQQDIMFRETLDQLDASHEQLNVVYALSDENWAGRTGYIQTHLGDVLEGVEDTDFYICGVPQMVVDTQDALADHGAPEDRIYTEGWEENAVNE
jgi:ferredoxin-NADP reductase